MIGVAGNAPVARSGTAAAVASTKVGNARQRRDGLMLEHRPRRDDEPGLARPAHQLDRHDAVAAEREEVVVDADALQPQHLGEQRAQQLLLRRARAARIVAGVRSGAGSALRSSLPLGVSGSLSSATNAAGTM